VLLPPIRQRLILVMADLSREPGGEAAQLMEPAITTATTIQMSNAMRMETNQRICGALLVKTRTPLQRSSAAGVCAQKRSTSRIRQCWIEPEEELHVVEMCLTFVTSRVGAELLPDVFDEDEPTFDDDAPELEAVDEVVVPVISTS